jgi:hypothetical protein
VPSANGSIGQIADISANTAGQGIIRAYGAFAESGLTTVTPTTGSTLTLADYTSPVFVNTGTLASLTIVMPPNPVHGQVQTIIFAGAITALTLNANAGQTIIGAPGSASVNTVLSFIYRGLAGATAWLPHNTAAAAAGTGGGTGPYLPTPGGTMTGALTLAADPTTALHAATKQYTDNMLPLAGGTMTGPLNYTATGGTTSRSAQNRAADTVQAKDFGAVFDGNSHPLSAYYGTLAAAQTVYPHAVALTDEIDGVAIQAAINFLSANISTYVGGGTVRLPAGRGLVNQPLSITASNVSLQGQTVGGIQYHPNVSYLNPSVATTLRWTGAARTTANGPLYFLTIRPGADSRANFGCSVQGIEFDCNSVAGVGGPRLLSCRVAVIDLGTREPAGVGYASAGLTINSQTVTVANTTGISIGDSIVSASLPDGAYVASVVNATTLTVSVQAIATSTETVTVGGTGILFDVMGGLADSNSTNTLRVRFYGQNFNGLQYATAPLVMIAGSGTGSGSGGTVYGNTSLNYFERLIGIHTWGVGVVVNNSDHNYHDFISMQRLPPGSGTALLFNGSLDPNNGSARYHVVRYTAGTDPIRVAGTDTGGFTTAAGGINFLNIDRHNGGTSPLWGVSASGWASFDDQPTLAVIGSVSAAVLAHLPDSTAAGGNVRGNYAVDLQILRTAATQVASGSQSVVLGGQSNTASATQSTVCGGINNNASGQQSAVLGGNANGASGLGAVSLGGSSNVASGNNSITMGTGAVSDLFAAVTQAGGLIAAGRRAQFSRQVLRAISAANTTPVRLTADGAAAGALNVCNVTYATSVYSISVNLTALDATNGNNFYVWTQPLGLLRRNGGVASTVYVPGTPTSLSNGTTTGIAITEAADTTNGGYSLTFTPPTGNTALWRVVATVEWTRVDGT